jgi:hypothetical protein
LKGTRDGIVSLQSTQQQETKPTNQNKTKNRWMHTGYIAAVGSCNMAAVVEGHSIPVVVVVAVVGSIVAVKVGHNHCVKIQIPNVVFCSTCCYVHGDTQLF